jgi:hypothetical protein
MTLRRSACLLLALCCFVAPVAHAEPNRPRVIVLSDIGNEPDDSQSFVRFLLYSNELEVEGLIATTSTWLTDRVNPSLIDERVRAYGKVLPNLRKHAAGFPDTPRLLQLVKSGRAEYGMRGVGSGKDTGASELIIRSVDRADPRPVWITVWGGAVDLAQALWKIRETRSPQDLETFVDKLRVYSISDQDDAGPWIRASFPKLFWIASIHAFGEYSQATWTGISGDLMRPMPGADRSIVTNEWLAAHIRKGPLGQLYPASKYIMEGDTPSFLYLLPNGLGVTEQPSFGSWGGRYAKVSEEFGSFANVADTVIGVNGERFQSAQATVWRWRAAFQNDFAARIQWSVTSDYRKANHNPELVVNGISGRAPVELVVKSGETVQLNAAGSRDPDRNEVSYRWWQYKEPSGVRDLPELSIQNAMTSEAQFVAPNILAPQVFHVLLEAVDNGSPRLTSYRRVMIRVSPRKTATSNSS